MKKPVISIVVAIAEKNRAIGKNGKLPWDIPEDLQHFKKVTMGHPIIMGRKTYESIGRPLPQRTNIIITRDSSYHAPGCIVVTSLKDAVEQARQYDNNEICIIGGGEIFKQSMEIADKLYLTLVKGNIEGDTFFPDYSMFKKVISKYDSSSNGYEYTFLELIK